MNSDSYIPYDSLSSYESAKRSNYEDSWRLWRQISVTVSRKTWAFDGDIGNAGVGSRRVTSMTITTTSVLERDVDDDGAGSCLVTSTSMTSVWRRWRESTMRKVFSLLRCRKNDVNARLRCPWWWRQHTVTEDHDDYVSSQRNDRRWGRSALGWMVDNGNVSPRLHASMTMTSALGEQVVEAVDDEDVGSRMKTSTTMTSKVRDETGRYRLL